MNRSHRVFALTTLAWVFMCARAGNAQLQCAGADVSGVQFEIQGTTIKMPVGAFLLVRKDGQIGAIRLVSIDVKATEYLGKSTYEAFFPADQSGSFLSGNGNVVRQSAVIEIKPEGGFYQRLCISTGTE
jgi:hypothetical protein